MKWIGCALLLFISLKGWAQIYTCSDDDGNVSYQSLPCQGSTLSGRGERDVLKSGYLSHPTYIDYSASCASGQCRCGDEMVTLPAEASSRLLVAMEKTPTLYFEYINAVDEVQQNSIRLFPPEHLTLNMHKKACVLELHQSVVRLLYPGMLNTLSNMDSVYRRAFQKANDQLLNF